MSVNTEKYKDLLQVFGLDIDFSDGQFLLAAFKGFADAKKTAYTEEERTVLNQAFILIKKVADKENDDFFKKYELRIKAKKLINEMKQAED